MILVLYTYSVKNAVYVHQLAYTVVKCDVIKRDDSPVIVCKTNAILYNKNRIYEIYRHVIAPRSSLRTYKYRIPRYYSRNTGVIHRYRGIEGILIIFLILCVRFRVYL